MNKKTVEIVFISPWGLPWRVVDRPSETPLEKTGFSVVCVYQLQIAPRWD